MGVFATRSPFRPNSLGLSCVRLLGVEQTAGHGTVLHVGGADLMDGTPIYDVKPYIAYSDAHEDAECGFAEDPDEGLLQVECAEELLQQLGENGPVLLKVLERDPRPAYQNDSERVYEMQFANWDVHFRVVDDVLTVTDVCPL